MSDQGLPQPIAESIAIVNAESLGDQSAILANIALANQIFNTNIQQQMLITQQQALSLVTLATAGRIVAMLTSDVSSAEAPQYETLLQAVTDLSEMVRKNANDLSRVAANAPKPQAEE